MLEAREDVAKLFALLKSNNEDLQQNALKNFMFVSTCSTVRQFLEPGNLKLLIDLGGSGNPRVESAALRLLWHLSAQAEMKCVLYEEGVYERIKAVMAKENPEDCLACSAVLQNISEHRFLKGELNPNQVKLVNDGILGSLSTLLNTDDKRVQFLACLTVCNLAMNTENHKKIRKSKLLDAVEHFVIENQLHVGIRNQMIGKYELKLMKKDMVCHWLTLQPHIPLLHSSLSQVQLFSLSSLLVLSRSETYKVEVWRCTSMNNGVGILFALSNSPDPAISKLACDIITVLQLEEPLVKCSHSDVGSDLGRMFNNPEFSDVKFRCGGSVLYGHKAILAARCPQFYAMFTHFKESRQDEITIPEETMEFPTLHIVCAFIYTGAARGITRTNAVDVLVAAQMYALMELKQYCERFLWHYVDTDNVALLYRTAATHDALQLLRVCSAFLLRNFARVARTSGFASLPAEDKDVILRMVKEKQQERVDSGDLDSQGQQIHVEAEANMVLV